MNDSLSITIAVVAVLVAAGVVCVWLMLHAKNMLHWIGPYLKVTRANRSVRTLAQQAGVIDVMFCFVDHFEPQWQRPSYDVEVDRVRRWTDGYPKLAAKHTDADGIPPQHTFFYPEEEYRPEHINELVDLCRAGFGEIEIHLHHHNDTVESLSAKLKKFINILHDDHAALPTDAKTGAPRWAFIHGNWALCNSDPDGHNCGVNEELTLFNELGCYVDMTMPSAPNASQAKTVNQIYRASTVPGQPRSHDFGELLKKDGPMAQGELLMLPGPLGLSRHMRKFGVVPKIENSDVRANLEGTPDRIDQWVDTHIHVQGKPEWVFVKIHTHGTQESDEEALLGESANRMYNHLEAKYNDGKNYRLHYVSSREMYNIVRAAEDGKNGNPNEYRDYQLIKARFEPKHCDS